MVRAAFWFALGVFTSMAVGLCLGVSATAAPSRGNSEEGLIIGLILGAPLLGILMGAIFGGWLALRRRWREVAWKRYGFAGPLLLGLACPVLMIGSVAAVMAIGPVRRSEALGSSLCALAVFGSPVALAEAGIRFGGSRRR